MKDPRICPVWAQLQLNHHAAKSCYHEKNDVCSHAIIKKKIKSVGQSFPGSYSQRLSKAVWSQLVTLNDASEELTGPTELLLGDQRRRTTLQCVSYSSPPSPWHAPYKLTIFLAAFKEIYLQIAFWCSISQLCNWFSSTTYVYILEVKSIKCGWNENGPCL